MYWQWLAVSQDFTHCSTDGVKRGFTHCSKDSVMQGFALIPWPTKQNPSQIPSLSHAGWPSWSVCSTWVFPFLWYHNATTPQHTTILLTQLIPSCVGSQLIFLTITFTLPWPSCVNLSFHLRQHWVTISPGSDWALDTGDMSKYSIR